MELADGSRQTLEITLYGILPKVFKECSEICRKGFLSCGSSMVLIFSAMDVNSLDWLDFIQNKLLKMECIIIILFNYSPSYTFQNVINRPKSNKKIHRKRSD